MKRLYTLVMFALLFCGNAWADSGLYLCGKEVPSTSDWYIDIHSDLDNVEMGSGFVSYVASTKTVTFKNAQAFVSGEDRILYNKNVPGLKIVFTGYSAYLLSHYCVFRFDVDTEIIDSTSGGLVLLQANGSGSQCIYCPNETQLIIRDFAKLQMTSQFWRALHTKGTRVDIYNSNIYMSGSDCAIQNDKGNDFIGYLHLNNCLMRDPWGNEFGSVGEGWTETTFGITLFYVHTSKAKSVMIIRDEDYIGVRLKGVALTKGWSINDDPSNPSYGIEDYYTYDESTKTLTLKKDIQAKTGYGDKMKDNLNDWIGIMIEKLISIEGDGHYVYGQRGISCDADATLNNIIVAGTEDGILVDDDDLTLKDDIIIGGVESAIEIKGSTNVKFNPSPGKTIMLVPCNDKFRETTSFEERPIVGYGAKLESCIITTPEGAKMWSNGPVLNGEYVSTKVVITGYATYDLWVGETQVTSLNASDILGDGGHFKYDASTNTLTVSNATLENTGNHGAISNEIDGLNVNFVGASTFTTGRRAIHSNKSINFTGSGSLKATVSNNHCCIDLYGNDIICNINGPQLDLTSNNYVIICDYSETSIINVTGTSTRLALHPGDNKQAIYYLKALNLGDGLYISEPVGGYFDPSLRNITVNGRNAYKGDVIIEKAPKNLGFSINGTEMTTSNMNNVPGVVSGYAYITLNSNDEPTLVLENATLNWNEPYYGLYNSDCNNFTIRVFGNCTLKAPDYCGIELDPDTETTITGGGTLTILSKWAGIETYDDTSLNIQNNTMVIAKSSNSCGYLDAGNDYGAWLRINDGGLLAAYGPEEPVSFGVRAPVLGSGTAIRYPVDATIWNNYVYNADGSKVMGDWVVIGPDNQATRDLITGVASPKSSPEGKDFIYNLAGQRLSRPQKGIYITNGRKVLVK